MITLKMALLPKLVRILCNTINVNGLPHRVSKKDFIWKHNRPNSQRKYPLSHAACCWFAPTCGILKANEYSESRKGTNEERKGAGEREKPETTFTRSA